MPTQTLTPHGSCSSSSSSCHSSSGTTARGEEYRRPRTSTAPALAALVGSKGPAMAATTIVAALSLPQASAVGTPAGRCFPPSSPPSPPRDRLLRGGDAPGGPAARRGAGPRRPRVSSNHPKVPSRHILDLISPRVSAPQLPPLSLTLSLLNRSYLPPPILPRLVLRLF